LTCQANCGIVILSLTLNFNYFASSETMPNRNSAKKELRKRVTLTAYNKKIKDNVKGLVKKSLKAIETNKEDAKETVAKTLKALDKAAQKGVMKKNTRNRRKSRIAKKLNKLSAEK
jgi:small subunit ribosomal protein S20